MDMIILYVLLIAYIVAINFYAFLLVKTLSKQEREEEVRQQGEPLTASENYSSKKPQKVIGKLCITGALGGAIAIYASMFIFKFRRSDLLLMVLMPLLGVVNVYVWVLLFRSGISFWTIQRAVEVLSILL